MFIRFHMITGAVFDEPVPDEFSMGMLQMAVYRNDGFHTQRVSLFKDHIVLMQLVDGTPPSGETVVTEGMTKQ